LNLKLTLKSCFGHLGARFLTHSVLVAPTPPSEENGEGEKAGLHEPWRGRGVNMKMRRSRFPARLPIFPQVESTGRRVFRYRTAPSSGLVRLSHVGSHAEGGLLKTRYAVVMIVFRSQGSHTWAMVGVRCEDVIWGWV
jgi:hypothetical protein